MKKVWDIVSTVLVWILVVVAVAMMIFTVVSVNTFDRNDRDLFGFKAFIVRSDSMSKTDFDAGDLILVKEVDPSTLKEGDIITYQSQGMENYGEIVTHKIRRLEYAPDGQPAFRTYGTTTDTHDPLSGYLLLRSWQAYGHTAQGWLLLRFSEDHPRLYRVHPAALPAAHWLPGPQLCEGLPSV